MNLKLFLGGNYTLVNVGLYINVCDTCKGAGVTYLHLNYASAKECADVMVEEINKIE